MCYHDHFNKKNATLISIYKIIEEYGEDQVDLPKCWPEYCQ